MPAKRTPRNPYCMLMGWVDTGWTPDNKPGGREGRGTPKARKLAKRGPGPGGPAYMLTVLTSKGMELITLLSEDAKPIGDPDTACVKRHPITRAGMHTYLQSTGCGVQTTCLQCSVLGMRAHHEAAGSREAYRRPRRGSC